jgi:hypothetical protein
MASMRSEMRLGTLKTPLPSFSRILGFHNPRVDPLVLYSRLVSRPTSKSSAYTANDRTRIDGFEISCCATCIDPRWPL